MTCITDTMTTFDWVVANLLLLLGVWKAISLINIYAPKLVNKIIEKVERRNK
jgi:hypothetical protein